MSSTHLTIAFAGGGTAGHVNPNLAIIERCQSQGHEVMYFGTPEGIEKELVERQGSIPFYSVPSERLRRYFSWRNFAAPLLVLRGIGVAWNKLRKLRPDILFSKGGFAAFPVVVGAWLNRIPIISHESDLTPGLANRMSHPFVKVICTGFKETLSFLNSPKARHTGSPIREAFAQRDPHSAIQRFKLDPKRPLILVSGGSQGAQHINEVVEQSLDALLALGQVVHARGPGNLDPQKSWPTGYHPYEYIHEGFPDLMALAELSICRAGANTLVELLTLNKTALLIPLPTKSSRGDQLANAEDFAAQGFGEMLRNEALNPSSIIEQVSKMMSNIPKYTHVIKARPSTDATQTILDLLIEHAKPRRK